MFALFLFAAVVHGFDHDAIQWEPKVQKVEPQEAEPVTTTSIPFTPRPNTPLLPMSSQCSTLQNIPAFRDSKSRAFQYTRPDIQGNKSAVFVYWAGSRKTRFSKKVLPSWYANFTTPHSIDIVVFVERDNGPSLETVEDSMGLSASASSSCRGTYRCYVVQGTLVILTFVKTPLRRPFDPNLDPKDVANWLPPRFRENDLTYIEGTTWYVYELFRYPIVAEYEVWFKLDLDVRFLKKVPFHPGRRMIQDKKLFFHTGTMHDSCCTYGLSECVDDYLNFESSFCGEHVAANGNGQPWFEDPSFAFYSNFIGGRVDVFRSMEITHFARFWTGSRARYLARWTDQQYWHKALGLVSNASKPWIDCSSWRMQQDWTPYSVVDSLQIFRHY